MTWGSPAPPSGSYAIYHFRRSSDRSVRRNAHTLIVADRGGPWPQSFGSPAPPSGTYAIYHFGRSSDWAVRREAYTLIVAIVFLLTCNRGGPWPPMSPMTWGSPAPPSGTYAIYHFRRSSDRAVRRDAHTLIAAQSLALAGSCNVLAHLTLRRLPSPSPLSQL